MRGVGARGYQMKISVVTISFNQVAFLERTIRSVTNERGVEIEYIIVDPGSNDGSRELIEQHRDLFAAVIFEPDHGPADGLNRGFARATGDIYFYLNSDDTVEPGAFAIAVRAFEADPALDVLCGHAWVVDENDNRIRRVWSDPWNPKAQSYGAAIQMQPSTYIKAEAFRKVGGFNIENRSNWDGELFVDLMLSGAKLKIIDQFMSGYRLHSQSITGAGGDEVRMREYTRRVFRKMMGRDMVPTDKYARLGWFLYRQLRNPAGFFERLLRGPVYRRMENAR